MALLCTDFDTAFYPICYRLRFSHPNYNQVRKSSMVCKMEGFTNNLFIFDQYWSSEIGFEMDRYISVEALQLRPELTKLWRPGTAFITIYRINYA